MVENDYGNADVIELILLEEHHEVITITESCLLAQTITLFSPQLIIMDILLNSDDGRLLCNNLKAQQATRHIPVLLITAMMESQARSVECQADFLMLKPFDYSVLTSKISHMIN